jgi:hypothetical protein
LLGHGSKNTDKIARNRSWSDGFRELQTGGGADTCHKKSLESDPMHKTADIAVDNYLDCFGQSTQLSRRGWVVTTFRPKREIEDEILDR